MASIWLKQEQNFVYPSLKFIVNMVCCYQYLHNSFILLLLERIAIILIVTGLIYGKRNRLKFLFRFWLFTYTLDYSSQIVHIVFALSIVHKCVRTTHMKTIRELVVFMERTVTVEVVLRLFINLSLKFWGNIVPALKKKGKKILDFGKEMNKNEHSHYDWEYRFLQHRRAI